MRAISGGRASSRLGVVAVVAVVAATTLLSGCGMVTIGGSTPAATPVAASASGTPTGTPGGTVTQSPAATGAQAQVLAALPQRPVTAKDWAGAKDPSFVGILTAEQFIEADYLQSTWADERGIQKGRGLQFAGRRNWMDPATGIYLDTFIIHYASAAGAESDYLSQVRADAKDYDAQGAYTVPGIGKSKVFVKAKLDSFGNSTTMGLALAGDNVLRIIMLNPAAPDHAAASSLLTGEYQALTKS